MSTTGLIIVSNPARFNDLQIILKITEVVLGILCVGISAYDITTDFDESQDIIKALIAGDEVRYYLIDQMTCRIIFLSLMTTFTIVSLVQLFLCPTSLSTAGSIISRTTLGVVYHSIGFGLQFAASLILHERLNLIKTYFINYDMMLAAAIIGLINAVLYLISGIIAQKSSMEVNIKQQRTIV